MKDGSVITLNTSSKLRVRYSAKERSVELLSGQANFEVAEQVARPFIVKAGRGEVRALGTVFDIYKSDDKITVTLIDGKVSVALDTHVLPHIPAIAEAPTGAGEVLLNPGEQISYGGRTSVGKPVEADVHRISAWRARKLEFDQTPLADAIADANRYSEVKIELHAPNLEQARISGVFEAGRNELFVEGLQSYFQFRVERPDHGRIVLTESH